VRRRRFSTNRVVRKTGNLIWVTTIVEASVLEIAGLDVADLVLPADWNTGGNFDRATLMGVRGWLALSQVGAATAAEAAGAYLAMYVSDQGAGAMAPAVAADYTIYDTLWTGGMTFTTATASTSAGNVGQQVEVKARRRMTSAQELRLALAITTDTATPRVKINGVMRALVKTE